MEETLDPPRVCCGRTFKLQRAYEGHLRSHIACANCTFHGCRAALKAHEWEAHGIGSPSSAKLLDPSTHEHGGYIRRDGGAFTVVDEPEAACTPLGVQYPGAEILWPLADGANDTACDSQESEESKDCGALFDIDWNVVTSCRVLVIVGAVGSGKSTFLHALTGYSPAAASIHHAAAHWPTGRSILDGLGPDGFRWLSAVGLSSVPLWCQPYRALSTGEAFRAELARRLQRSAITMAPLVVDGFCDHLDTLSAASCAASLARHLRNEGAQTRAVLACSHAHICKWLRPDGVVVCREKAAPVLFRIRDAQRSMPLQIRVHSNPQLAPAGGAKGQDHAQTTEEGLPVARGGELFVHALRHSCLPLLRKHCYDDSPPFRHDANAALPRGGRVLASRVEMTAATQLCDTFFDLPHDGTCSRRLPSFPPVSELEPFRLGLLCGPSGAAKSALLAAHFASPAPLRWPGDVPLSALFEDVNQAERCLQAVDLPLPMALRWHRTSCSGGQRAQAHLAFALAVAESGAARLATFDEFGSAWDDATTDRISKALSRACHTTNALRCRGVVLAGCHVTHVRAGALEPDWVFEAASATCFWFARPPPSTPPSGCDAATSHGIAAIELERARSVGFALEKAAIGWQLHWEVSKLPKQPHGGLVDGGAIELEHPRLQLCLRLCAPHEWQRFHSYHYKTAQLSIVATTFLLEAILVVGDDAQGPHAADTLVSVPAGFAATIPHSGKRSEGATAPPQRAHRTVVLPEWQGFGIGSRLSDAVAEWHLRRGSDYFGQTVHPRFGGYRDASPLWEPTQANHTTPQLRWLPRRLTGASKQQAMAVRKQRPKMVFAHRYIGGAVSDQAQRHLEARVSFASCDDDTTFTAHHEKARLSPHPYIAPSL